jgi:predicted aconitase
MLKIGALHKRSEGDQMPYLNQKRKSATDRMKAFDAAKPQVKVAVKMPAPVKIPAPSQAKG